MVVAENVDNNVMVEFHNTKRPPPKQKHTQKKWGSLWHYVAPQISDSPGGIQSSPLTNVYTDYHDFLLWKNVVVSLFSPSTWKITMCPKHDSHRTNTPAIIHLSPCRTSPYGRSSTNIYVPWASSWLRNRPRTFLPFSHDLKTLIPTCLPQRL